MIKQEEFRYRIIEESNLSGEKPKYFVQIYRKNYLTMFNRREWQFEMESVDRKGFWHSRIKEFDSFDAATLHVKKLARVLRVKEEGIIQRDIIE